MPLPHSLSPFVTTLLNPKGYKVIHKISPTLALCAFSSISTLCTLTTFQLRGGRTILERVFLRMAITGQVLRRNLPENVEVFDDSPSGSLELHVLAVDDSVVDRMVIERLLKISSCKVTTVESGTRALQYLGLDGEKGPVGFDGLKVNLIMTDYSMPGMTGYELLKKIKGSSVLREIPVVIMSSENVLARIDRCLEEGAEDFLLKPVKLSDVRRLKDFITRGEGKNGGETRNHKREREDDYTSSSSLSSSSPPSSSSEMSSSSSTFVRFSKRAKLRNKD